VTRETRRKWERANAVTPPRGIHNTAVCVRCLKRKATVHTGHVTAGGPRKIGAGWCSRCFAKLRSDSFAGWVGHWLPAMNPEKPLRLTVDVGELMRSHIKNRAKRLGITAGELVWRAVLRASDRELVRP
jgi:hypothetical protein